MDSALNKKQKETVRCAIDLGGHLSHPPLEHLSALVGKKNTPECLGGWCHWLDP